MRRTWLEYLFDGAKVSWLVAFGLMVCYGIYALFHFSSCETISYEQLQISFDGRVKAKRHPAQSHNRFYVDIAAGLTTTAGTQDVSYEVVQRGNEYDFWESVQIGERVEKQESSSLFVVYKHDGTILQHRFRCDGPGETSVIGRQQDFPAPKP